MNPGLNTEVIEKLCNKELNTNNGGAGGEFFFFSYNNQVVLKTINQEELNLLLKNLKDYQEYLQNNKGTYISKIYGIFGFTKLDKRGNFAATTEYFIIQRNIS